MGKLTVSIVTRERSGSTVFQRFLATHPGLDLLGELWNAGSAGAAFYVYWKQRILENDRNLRLNNLGRLFGEFLDQKLAASKNGVVFDAKYGHLDNLRFFWSPKFDNGGRATIGEPTLLRELKRRECHIFHLTRRNKLAIYVSTQRARESGVWQRSRNDEPAASAAEKLDIDLEALASFVMRERHMDALVSRYLARYERHLPLFYEDFLPGDTERLSDDFVRSVAGFIGEKADSFDPVLRLRKVLQGPLADQVQRPDAVRAALRAIDCGWMIDGAA